MHRDAEAVHVERDGARGAAPAALGDEVDPRVVGGARDVGQRQDRPGAVDSAGHEPAVAGRRARDPGRDLEHRLGEVLRGGERRLARDDRAGGPERAGVVLDEVGVGLPHDDVGGVLPERAGDELGVDGRRAVAELGGPDLGLDDPVRPDPHAGVRVVPAGRTVSIMDSAVPSPTPHSGPRSGSASGPDPARAPYAATSRARPRASASAARSRHWSSP